MSASRRIRCLDERGAALVLVALLLVLCMVAAALAVDIGVLTTARTEAQRSADMAAHAGASALILSPYDEAAAREAAVAYAKKNDIRGAPSIVLPADVEVFLDESKVRVTVLHNGDPERGSAIGTFFARLMGVNEVDIGAKAAAVARSAGSVDCLLPVAVADLWTEADGTRADENDTWDPEEGDYFDGSHGYTTADLGRLITLKPSQGASSKNTGQGRDGFPDSNRFTPGWWYLWYPTSGRGAKTLREQVLRCPEPQTPWGVGDWVTDKNGNTQSIQKAFNELVAMDPDARWDQSCKCVKDSRFPVSPRLRGASPYWL